jgi:predicted TIM-barrel fold metal-dependent hydrolase
MPDFPIIDSHVHLYDVERLSYGWMKGWSAPTRWSNLNVNAWLAFGLLE